MVVEEGHQIGPTPRQNVGFEHGCIWRHDEREHHLGAVGNSGRTLSTKISPANVTVGSMVFNAILSTAERLPP